MGVLVVIFAVLLVGFFDDGSGWGALSSVKASCAGCKELIRGQDCLFLLRLFVGVCAAPGGVRGLRVCIGIWKRFRRFGMILLHFLSVLFLLPGCLFLLHCVRG